MSFEEVGKAEMEEIRKFQQTRADVRAEKIASEWAPSFLPIHASVKLIRNLNRWGGARGRLEKLIGR
ncbi:MAG: hypothetical protein CL912_24065 [Deltaproteobacteria bacterium]|nr:hypothetical protein [Deltaproteobacteria bacterium]